MLAEGLIGLSLRPLAKAVGTSDRMLIYHFGNRDGLVAAVIDEATNRSVAYLRGPAREPLGARRCAAAVAGVHRAAAVRLQPHLRAGGRERVPRPGAVPDRRSATPTPAGRRRCATGSSAAARQPPRVERITQLVESALLGFHVDLSTDSPEELSRGVRDLADAAQALAG